ncbi:MAG: phosphatase PAP2 family protein [Anaerovoracaceae bacterium]
MNRKVEEYKGKHIYLYVLAIVCALGFGVLMYNVMVNGQLPFDQPILDKFYGLRVPAVSIIVELVTYLGNWEAIVVIGVLLFAFEQYRKDFGIPVLALAAATSVLNKVIKVIVARPRPEASMMLIDQGGYSFASGHSVTSIAVYGLLVFLLIKHKPNHYKPLAVLCGVLAIIIGISRVYVGVHFPSDVLAGWCEGLALLAIGLVLLDKFQMPNLTFEKGALSEEEARRLYGDNDNLNN